MSFTSDFSAFATRLRGYIGRTSAAGGSACPSGDADEFGRLARELFGLQYRANVPYRRLCEARGVTPETVAHWSEIPAVPTRAFKELELSCLPLKSRTAIFHSSGTTEQRPSRNFHSPESLAVYEASLLPGFMRHLLPELRASPSTQDQTPESVILTPSREQAPHSSLVYMFETVRRQLGAPEAAFFGTIDADGCWELDLERLSPALHQACDIRRPVMLMGTAFLFVHLLDHLQASGVRLKLPPGSRVLETGGYKGRSRSLPKRELHAFITERLAVSASHIVCEYGMSELSSQAYDRVAGQGAEDGRSTLTHHHALVAPKSDVGGSSLTPHFRFPPWARVRVVSPETGCEVSEGEPGLIQIFDLANVFSTLAVQTEDLGIKRGKGFELVGRAAVAEPRGCSLMAVGG